MKELPDKLREILARKRIEVEALQPHREGLRKMALARNEFRGFRTALQQASLGLIAEVKRASPSAGVIQPDFDPLAHARAYEVGGAHALSVLTDQQFFQGHISHLRDVRQAVRLPVLRKDFIIAPEQIWEASVAGADAVLLIVAALELADLEALYEEARTLGMDALVEVHDLAEMDIALELGADLIGVNNRNLHTFVVSIEATEQLAEEAPDDVVLVSESGIKTRADVERVVTVGADAILVGETLMRSQDIRGTIATLLGEER